jgi:hypothetical protein
MNLAKTLNRNLLLKNKYNKKDWRLRDDKLLKLYKNLLDRDN